jgi:hypothetical protein
MEPFPSSAAEPRRVPWRHLALLLCVGSVIPAYLLATRPPLYNTDSFWTTGQPWSPFVVPHFPPLYPLFTRAVNFVTMYLGYRHTGDFYHGLAYNLNDPGVYAIVAIQHALAVLAMAVIALHAAATLPRRLLAMLLMSANPVVFLCCHNVMTEGLLCSLVVFLLVFALRVVRHPGAGSWRDHLGCFVFLFLCIWTRHPASVLAALVPGVSLLRLAVRRDRTAALKFAAALACALLAIWTTGEASRRFCEHFNHQKYVNPWGRAGSYRVLGPGWDRQPAEKRDAFIRAAQANAADPRVARAIPEVLRDNNAWVGSWQAVRKVLVESGSPSPADNEVDAALNGVCRAAYSARDPEVLRSARVDFCTYLWGARLNELIANPLIQTGVPVHRDSIKSDASLVKMCKHLSQFDEGVDVAALADVDRHFGCRVLQKMAPFTNLDCLLALLAITLAAYGLRLTDGTTALFAAVGLAVVVVYFALMALMTCSMWRYALVGTFLYHPIAGLLAGSIGLRRSGAAAQAPSAPAAQPPTRRAAA